MLKLKAYAAMACAALLSGAACGGDGASKVLGVSCG
jgi:hypothetical protein